MSLLLRRWRWLACLALAVGCTLNPQPEIPGDAASSGGATGTAGGPPVTNIAGSGGVASFAGGGPTTQPGGSGSAEAGAGGGASLEGGAPGMGEAGQGGSTEAGAMGVLGR